MAMDGPLGTVLNSLPYYGSNGCLIGADPVARAELVTAYRNQVQAPGIAASTLIENPLSPGDVNGLPYDLRMSVLVR